MASEHAIDVRPYQIMCLVCRAGGNPHPAATAAQLRNLALAIRRHPVVPLTLRCNVASHYRYQNPGDTDDSPGGALFNAKRDLDIVQRLGLVPGDTRPAWELLKRLMDSIPTAMGIADTIGKLARRGATVRTRLPASTNGALLAVSARSFLRVLRRTRHTIKFAPRPRCSTLGICIFARTI